MFFQLVKRAIFSSKNYLFLFSFFLATFSLLQKPSLEAGGMGRTDEVYEYEGIAWNGVFFDMNELNFEASIPNYADVVLQNGLVTLRGEAGKDEGYIIVTTFNKGYKTPKSYKEFVKIIQEANPDSIVKEVQYKKSRAKYIVDLIPINKDEADFWRFLCIEDRLIKMGTADANENRRLNFFESMRIFQSKD